MSVFQQVIVTHTFSHYFHKRSMIIIHHLLFLSFLKNQKNAWRAFLLKSISAFRFWTFFLSIFEKGKYFWVKNRGKMPPEHNALFLFFMQKNVLPYFFL